MLHPSEEEGRLLSRAAELLSRARGGEITATSYLTPREQLLLTEGLGASPRELVRDGGFPDAERARIFFLPDYAADADDALRAEMLSPIRDELILAVLVKGSGYRELAHRDYLGAILNLGIKRETVGDICVLGAHEAVLFTEAVIARFLMENLTRVANDAVRVKQIGITKDFDCGRRFARLSDTVPSPRADAVVAALSNLAREKAQALIREGRVEIGYELTQKPDRTVREGEVVSVRGVGKFRIVSLSEQTKKGRFRLLADRYL